MQNDVATIARGLNIYRHRFTATCPNNGQTIAYRLEIEAESVIMVEDIDKHCRAAALCNKPYHENIANYLYASLGGRQTIIAWHHGTEIETRRG